eukprot:TRINITY_DN7792_c0_g1_i1.p1 TRINITY_DN7792_c0_g1~~TRINITY_DN7792_c0_g1_i1.p1  ORF type:complete len:249 (+),score=71.10 TRINITY_DN7792_c0_g1_i1:29-748(+)
MFRECTAALAEKPPFSWFQPNQNYQFLFLGLEGAGKTTFLYKLRINGYKKAEITKDLEYLKKQGKDKGFHYEGEFSSAHCGQYGIWDIPGNDEMRRLWPLFYRYIRISCVFFVVDAFSEDACKLTKENLKRLTKARETMFYLLNEDELRKSAFFLVLNVADRKTAGTEDMQKTLEQEQLDMALFEMLGVPELERAPQHKNRFRKVVLSCANITRRDQEWENTLSEFRKIQHRVEEELQD